MKVEANGRVLLPADVRRQLGVGPGDTLLAQVDEGGLRVWTPEIALQRARAMVSEFLPADRSLVDDLYAQRRADTARSDEKFGLTARKKRRGAR